MIEAKNVCKSFDGVAVLKNVSASFESSKTNLIIGQSGSGKTVFMKSLIGIYEIDSGSVYYDDINFTKMSVSEKKKTHAMVGMIFQGGALFDSMNVEENVMFPLHMHTHMSEQEKLERVNFCLEKVDLSGSNKKRTGELSGGMVKRLAIARAIALNPKYLFCDEPNSGLDPRTAARIDKLIFNLTKEFHMTTIINTHDMNSVLQIGENVIYIHEGQSWWQGTRDNILDSDNEALNNFIYTNEMIKKLKNQS